MARVCKPGGKILLLEHGRSHYSWLNRTLDEGAVRHHKTWGCMWNRSILDLVRKVGGALAACLSIRLGLEAARCSAATLLSHA